MSLSRREAMIYAGCLSAAAMIHAKEISESENPNALLLQKAWELYPDARQDAFALGRGERKSKKETNGRYFQSH